MSRTALRPMTQHVWTKSGPIVRQCRGTCRQTKGQVASWCWGLYRKTVEWSPVHIRARSGKLLTGRHSGSRWPWPLQAERAGPQGEGHLPEFVPSGGPECAFECKREDECLRQQSNAGDCRQGRLKRSFDDVSGVQNSDGLQLSTNRDGETAQTEYFSSLPLSNPKASAPHARHGTPWSQILPGHGFP